MSDAQGDLRRLPAGADHDWRDRHLLLLLLLVSLALFAAACRSLSPASAGPPVRIDQSDPGAQAAANEVALLAMAVPPRDLVALARAFGRTDAALAPTPPAAQAPSPGSVASFWIKDNDAGTNRRVEAALVERRGALYLWLDREAQVDAGRLAAAAQRIDESILPLLRRLMTAPPDATANDAHDAIHLLLTRGLGRQIIGYFSAADAYSTAVNPYSNERDMLYINLDRAAPGSEGFYEVVAHELAHLFHWRQDRDESAWIEEGTAELAAQLAGYNQQAYEDAFAAAPDVQLTQFSQSPGLSARHYGASFLFMAYFHERFGDEGVRRLVASPENGAAGVMAALPVAAPAMFTDLFADWLAANALAGRAAPPPLYSYGDLAVKAMSPVATLEGPGDGGEDAVAPFAAHYYDLRLDGPATLVFTGTRQVPLLPTIAHSGAAFWSTLPADSANMTLTREFDLSGLSAATLSFWTWYELESGWDYAYVAVSTDGGATWSAQPTIYTTLADPQGNSYGPGLTGRSGSGEGASWVEQTVDLGPYVGRSILVRFQVVNDQAQQEAGFALDDVRLPELGYEADFEQGTGGWQPAGFVRHTNVLPQHWLLLLVRPESTADTVRRLDVVDGRASWPLDPGAGDDRAILVVAGVTPVTTLPAGYRVALEPTVSP